MVRAQTIFGGQAHAQGLGRRVEASARDGRPGLLAAQDERRLKKVEEVDEAGIDEGAMRLGASLDEQ